MTAANLTRVYVTHAPDGSNERLVRASHPGHARAHSTHVRVASQNDLVRLLGKGLSVETADNGIDVDPQQALGDYI